MGFSQETLETLLLILKSQFTSFNDIKMLELGNQYAEHSDCAAVFNTYSYIPSSILSKNFFTFLSINCISIDINNEDNSYFCDLRNISEDPKLLNNFDIITNLGTLEHIGQYESPDLLLQYQYVALKNIHSFGKEGCIYYHVVPLKGYWYKHGACDYTPEFWTSFCTLCSYTILNEPYTISYRPDLLLGIVFKKTQTSIFPSFEEFSKLPGLRSTYFD
jgi:hypothetical protein